MILVSTTSIMNQGSLIRCCTTFLLPLAQSRTSKSLRYVCQDGNAYRVWMTLIYKDHRPDVTVLMQEYGKNELAIYRMKEILTCYGPNFFIEQSELRFCRIRRKRSCWNCFENNEWTKTIQLCKEGRILITWLRVNATTNWYLLLGNPVKLGTTDWTE